MKIIQIKKNCKRKQGSPPEKENNTIEKSQKDNTLLNEKSSTIQANKSEKVVEINNDKSKFNDLSKDLDYKRKP